MKKEWRPIEGFKDYEISNYGEIRKWIDIFGDVQWINPITLGGVPELRKYVTLVDEDGNPMIVDVHREVYKAFKPAFYSDEEPVRFKDSRCVDISLDNLYTDAEMLESEPKSDEPYKKEYIWPLKSSLPDVPETYTARPKKKHSSAIEVIAKKGDIRLEFESQSQAARVLGLKLVDVRQCTRGEIGDCEGWTFERKYPEEPQTLSVGIPNITGSGLFE